jgi:hypothetical protein
MCERARRVLMHCERSMLFRFHTQIDRRIETPPIVYVARASSAANVVLSALGNSTSWAPGGNGGWLGAGQAPG